MSLLILGSYDGTVTVLEHTEGKPPKDALQVVSSTKDCAPNPSWITIDTKRSIIFCNSNDGASGKGSLKSFSIKNGFTELSSISAPVGAAYHTLYNDCKNLAIPYYYSGVIETYNVEDASSLQRLQTIRFPDFIPGPGRSQEQSRPHQTVVDPTGQYLLVPDLGADKIRVFSIKDQLTEIKGLQLRRPSFPRHVIFVKLGNKTMLYILNQDIRTLLIYHVEYDDGLVFHNEGKEIDLMIRGDRVAEIPVLPPGEHGVTASHLAVSPDNKFLIVSIRKDRSFKIQSPLDPDVTIPADSMVSYHIGQSGALSFAHESHSGGLIPRQFSLNEKGDRIAITQQRNGMISIYERDLETGCIKKLLAVKGGFGEDGPACVKWHNQNQDWC